MTFIVLFKCFYYIFLFYFKFRGRVFIDSVSLVLFCLTWIFGLYCIAKEADFAPQFFFCIFLSCTVCSSAWLYSTNGRCELQIIISGPIRWSEFSFVFLNHVFALVIKKATFLPIGPKIVICNEY